MPDLRPPHQASHELHALEGKTTDEVLTMLPYELYGPVSTLGSQIDLLASGAFEDDDLGSILQHLRDATNQLSRLVVALKRYNADQPHPADPPA